MKMKLYRIEPKGRPELYVVATTEQKAVEIYVNREIERGRKMVGFYSQRCDGKLPPEMQLHFGAILSRKMFGFATFSTVNGWSFRPIA